MMDRDASLQGLSDAPDTSTAKKRKRRNKKKKNKQKDQNENDTQNGDDEPNSARQITPMIIEDSESLNSQRVNVPEKAGRLVLPGDEEAGDVSGRARENGKAKKRGYDLGHTPLKYKLGDSFYEDSDSSEDEGLPDYKIGGYHCMHVGEVLVGRYVII